MKFQKMIVAIGAIAAFTLSAAAQQDTKKPEEKIRKQYKAKLAKKVGADKYGMRTYVLVLLKTGPAKIEDKAEVNKLFGGHMANIGQLAKEGKLAIAGPFTKDPAYRGLFILAVSTIDEAKALTETDPAVKSGLLAADYHMWYGSAALMEVNAIHDKVQKVDM